MCVSPTRTWLFFTMCRIISSDKTVEGRCTVHARTTDTNVGEKQQLGGGAARRS